MSRKIAPAVRSVVALAACSMTSAAQQAPPPARAGIFEEGRRAPPLELPSIDGRSTVSLADLAGRKAVVLQFASW